MANFDDFLGDFSRRFGKGMGEQQQGSERPPFGPGGNLFDRFRGAPLWKVALLGAGAFAAVGTALFSVLLAMAALFLLLLLFGALFGVPTGRADHSVAFEPPPTYH